MAEGSEALGYLAVLIATVFFGSNFVPVKRYETFDGMYCACRSCDLIPCARKMTQRCI